MSKEVARREVSPFICQGFTDWPYPNFYLENLQVGSYSGLSDDEITKKANEYNSYLKDPLMPRARAEVGRVLTHLAFEAAYRLGAFSIPENASEIMETQSGEVLS